MGKMLINWLSENWGNLIIGIILLLIVAFSIRSIWRRKKEGKCSGCTFTETCSSTDSACCPSAQYISAKLTNAAKLSGKGQNEANNPLNNIKFEDLARKSMDPRFHEKLLALSGGAEDPIRKKTTYCFDKINLEELEELEKLLKEQDLLK